MSHQEDGVYAEGTPERVRHDVFVRDAVITHLESQLTRVRALIDQWREEYRQAKAGDGPWEAGEAFAIKACADELDAALKER